MYLFQGDWIHITYLIKILIPNHWPWIKKNVTKRTSDCWWFKNPGNQLIWAKLSHYFAVIFHIPDGLPYFFHQQYHLQPPTAPAVAVAAPVLGPTSSKALRLSNLRIEGPKAVPNKKTSFVRYKSHIYLSIYIYTYYIYVYHIISCHIFIWHIDNLLYSYLVVVRL